MTPQLLWSYQNAMQRIPDSWICLNRHLTSLSSLPLFLAILPRTAETIALKYMGLEWQTTIGFGSSSMLICSTSFHIAGK